MTTTVGTAPTPAPATRTARFGPLTIAYDDRVLRPRPWTARQSLWAAELLTTAPRGPVLELCAGAGQIGLLAVAATQRQLVCVELDPVACDYARRNANAAGIGDRVEVRNADLATAVRPDERFAFVVADPPYLRPDEVAAHPGDPPLAVDGGADGLAVARRCLDVIRGHLLPAGSALLQLRGTEQATRIRDVVAESGDLTVAGSRTYGHGSIVLLQRR